MIHFDTFFLFTVSCQIETYADIGFCTVHRSPNHGRIEIISPRIRCINDRVLLLEVRQILASHIDRPATEITSHLHTKLFEATITTTP